MADMPYHLRGKKFCRAMLGEEAIHLANCLMKLPENQREAVRLRHLEGWTLDEISKRLEATPSAVAGYLKRGMHTLRKLMRDES